MNRFLVSHASWFIVAACVAPLEASHEPQTNGPVSTRIVEDVWDGPEFCYPCFFENTELTARTLRAETSAGHITALDVTFVGDLLHQTGSGFSLLRNDDTHFLFDAVAEALDVTTIVDDPSQLSSSFSGFTPFENRDIAQVVLDLGFSPSASYVARVTVDLGNNDVQMYKLSDSIVPGFIPEPSTVYLSLVAAATLLVARRHRTLKRNDPESLSA